MGVPSGAVLEARGMAEQRHIGKGLFFCIAGVIVLVMGIGSYLGGWAGVPPGWVPGPLINVPGWVAVLGGIWLIALGKGALFPRGGAPSGPTDEV